MRYELKTLKEATRLQCLDGSWNHSPYMFGVANGLIAALAIIENKTPVHLVAPKTWLIDKPDNSTGE